MGEVNTARSLSISLSRPVTLGLDNNEGKQNKLNVKNITATFVPDGQGYMSLEQLNVRYVNPGTLMAEQVELTNKSSKGTDYEGVIEDILVSNGAPASRETIRLVLDILGSETIRNLVEKTPTKDDDDNLRTLLLEFSRKSMYQNQEYLRHKKALK